VPGEHPIISGVNFTPQDLSACALARDSETLLRESLARLRPFVKELIVGDMGLQRPQPPRRSGEVDCPGPEGTDGDDMTVVDNVKLRWGEG
jgi:hypothetical protein